MSPSVLGPVTDPLSTQLADWIELVILAGHRRFVSARKASDLIERSGGLGDETDVALAFGVLHSRAELGYDLYPFSFSRLGIEAREDARRTPYEALVIASGIAAGHVEIRGEDRSALMLERLVTAAAGSLFGPDTVAIRFGHPPEGGRPSGFPEAVEWLSSRLKASTLPLRGSALRRADGGIDVIAWRTFADSRPPGPVVVIQVTFENDLRGKSLEIAANDLQRWMDIASPVPALAVPFDGGDDPDLYYELTSRVLVLDRWRILECLQRRSDIDYTGLAAWTGSVLADLTV